MTLSEAASDLIEQLELTPHPEGGYFREIFRSERTVERGVHGGKQRRSALTTIHYLLPRGQVSRWHVVASDEVWHFGRGEPLELFTYSPQRGAIERVVLGSGPEECLVTVVPADTWQAARPLGDFALCSCTVGPGFEFEDFEFAIDGDDAAAAFEADLKAYRDLA